MCFYWRDIEKAGQKKTLSLEEIRRIAKNFKNLAHLSVTGGEPTLREDLDEIIYIFYKNSNTRFATFSTNGLLPERTEKIAASVLRRCPDISLKVYISIDHLGDKHDEIRGVKGAFGKALETFSRLRRLSERHRNLYVFVETVLSAYNQDEIFKIIDYIRQNIKPDGQSLTLARGNTREKNAKDVTALRYKKAMDYMRNQAGAKKGLIQILLDLMMEVNFKTLDRDRMVLPCVAGKRMLTLTDEGLIMPCEMLGQISPGGNFVMGNLRKADYDINTVLNSQQSRKISNFIRKTKCHCTFECATLCNIVFNFKMYPRVLIRLFNG
jgi:MoaA/NifB/PqqE/SkfB family radical SAM enzyme